MKKTHNTDTKIGELMHYIYGSVMIHACGTGLMSFFRIEDRQNVLLCCLGFGIPIQEELLVLHTSKTRLLYEYTSCELNRI
jgi:hypothetical protein